MKRWLPAVSLALMLPWVTGFDLSRHSVPPEEILGGGPAKDGIPAILDPKFVSPNEAKYLSDDDRVIGVVRKGEAKAYPLRILNWHEVVNDKVADRSVAVSY